MSYSILHDNGISEYALNKIVNKELVDSESIVEHCIIGEENIKSYPFINKVKNVIKYHHEKLNGKGYPYRKKAEDLDFNSRLMGCLDIYQALTEERPYRNPASHEDTIKIMKSMAKEGYIDMNRVEDIDEIFKNFIDK